MISLLLEKTSMKQIAITGLICNTANLGHWFVLYNVFIEEKIYLTFFSITTLKVTVVGVPG